MSKYNKKNLFLLFYLIFIGFFAIFFLYSKHNVGNDSSISDWIINYQGGFTRRGLAGEISFFFATLFNTSLRFVIFIFQSFFHLFYLILFFYFIKDMEDKFILKLAFFSPIFLLFPIADIESLGRKETIIFVFYLLLLYLSDVRLKSYFTNTYVFFIFPIAFLIWEPVIFFFPYILFILFVKNHSKNFLKLYIKIFFISLPSLVVFFLIIYFPLSTEGWKIMCKTLEESFNQNCYMSAALLENKKGILTQFIVNIPDYKPIYLLRYFFIFLIGFLPVIIILFNSKFKKKYFFYFKKTILIFILLNIFVPIFFLSLFDWGRGINIFYSFCLLTLIFCIKNKIIIISLNKNFLLAIKKKISPKIINLFFFIYIFTWNIKTTIREDIGSFPLWRVPYKFYKLFLM